MAKGDRWTGTWERGGRHARGRVLRDFRALESRMKRKFPVRFGGGRQKRGRKATALTAHPICVVLVSCNHPLSGRRHSINVPGATGKPEVERPNGRKQPAQVKSHGKPESTRRPRGEPRLARSRLHCFKPNPERKISGPAATLVLRRRVMGADCKRLTVRQDRPLQQSGR
jgi:hypothetical protein